MTSRLRFFLMPLALLALSTAPVLAQEAPAPTEQAAPEDPTAPDQAMPEQAPAEPEASEAVEPTPLEAPPVVAAPAPMVGPLPGPQPGKGQIVFYRRGGQPGMALTFSVREGGTGVAKLPSGTYLVLPVEPGEHTFIIESEAKDALTLEVDDGETYFVEQTMSMGFVVGHPHLTPSTQDAFQKAFKKLKISTAVPTDKKGK